MEDFTENFLGYIINAVDILIVTYIIYKLILLLRGTRALQLFKGIIVIVVVMLASTVSAIAYIAMVDGQGFYIWSFCDTGYFSTRAAACAGTNRPRASVSRSSAPEEKAVADAVEAIVKSVFYMAKRRIGALIVIERETGLSDYIETGINLTARSSTELLINIFIPNTPLHDGAVIMRKDMVMAAGCYLPLSENPTISKELGTRHRAAIGLSEVSDALAVVVSEETGQVSIALNGEISRDYDQEKLTELLYEKLTQQGRATAPIWQRKVKNDG